MKKFFIIAIAVLILVLGFQSAKVVYAEQDEGVSAAGAVLELQDLVIRKNKGASEVNFRVIVKNIGTVTAVNLKDNLVVYLRVKNHRTGYWNLLQKWTNIDEIKPGDIVARDRTATSKNFDVLSDKFTLQAEIVLEEPGYTVISKKIVESTNPIDSLK
ncbi:MAG: hypothetical protein V2A78_12410 [bacterium]